MSILCKPWRDFQLRLHQSPFGRSESVTGRAVRKIRVKISGS